MDRRQFVVGSAATLLATGPALAQEAFPTRPITIVNAFPPGGINDLVTRPLAVALEPILKQPVLVETKAGAAGQIGAQFAASAKPDGYTLLSHNNGISGYAEVDKLFGRPVKTSRSDFIPLARLVADPILLLVNDRQPYKTLKEFLDSAKAQSNTSGVQFGRTLRRDAFAAGLSGAGDRTAEAAPSADRRRRPGHRRHSGQQRAGDRTVDVGDVAARQGRQAASARQLRRHALVGAAGRTDAEGARFRRRILPVGGHLRAERHAARDRHHVARGDRQGRAVRFLQDGADQCRPAAGLSRWAGLPEVLGCGRQAHRRGGDLDRQTGIRRSATSWPGTARRRRRKRPGVPAIHDFASTRDSTT